MADEHPPAVFVYTSRRALLIPRSAGFHDIAYALEKGGGGERAQMAAVLPFLEAAPPPFRIAALLLMGSATKLRH